MRANVIIFVLLVILFSGCAEKQCTDQIVYVPQKCHVEIVQEPQIQQCDTKNLLEWGKCAYRNYLKEKEARELQVSNAKVCE